MQNGTESFGNVGAGNVTCTALNDSIENSVLPDIP